jgi:REP element-mobilizing transposase RayT
MGRPRREFEQGVYHISSHGSDTRHLYRSDADRRDFLKRMSSTFWTRDIDVLAYALLGNHYHALVRIPDDGFSEALQRLHTEYSRHHNLRHRRSAHLFRAHCLARRITDDDDLLGLYRYIACNPVRAGLAQTPVGWPWASTRAHAGYEPAAIPIDEQPLHALLGPDAHWRHRYAAFVASDDGRGEVRLASLGTGSPHR